MYKTNKEEKRLYRIKTTRTFIASHTKASYLNNTKWRELLDRVWELNAPFAYKTLLEDNWKDCSFIRELEEQAVLLDDTGDFIEFLEIEAIEVPSEERLSDFLNLKHIPYTIQNGKLLIQAYRL